MTYGRTEGERAQMARGLALFFGAGAVLVFATLALPHHANTDDLGVAVAPGLAAVVCAFLLARQRHVPVLALQVLLALGSVLIAVCVRYGGDSSSAYQLMLTWVLLYAGFFFSTPAAAVQFVVAAVAYAVALALGDGTPVPSVHWLMALGTGAVALVLLASVARQVRGSAADLEAVADVASLGIDEAFRQEICERLLVSAVADAVAMFERLPDDSGVLVVATAGSHDAVQVLAGDAERALLQRVYRQARPEVLDAREPSRLLGSCAGFAQPVVRDERAVAVLVCVWTRPRRQVPDRAKTAALLFAGEASLGLERLERASREHQTRAMDINDNIVQGLVLAKYALDRGQLRTATRTIERTLGRARELMNDQLDVLATERGGLRPGDLVREEPAEPGAASGA